MLFSSFSPWMIILPVFVVQYGLAIFCLSKLAYCEITLKQYVFWNIFILLGIFVGSIAFLIYYAVNRGRLRKKGANDTIVLDEPQQEPEKSEKGDDEGQQKN